MTAAISFSWKHTRQSSLYSWELELSGLIAKAQITRLKICLLLMHSFVCTHIKIKCLSFKVSIDLVGAASSSWLLKRIYLKKKKRQRKWWKNAKTNHQMSLISWYLNFINRHFKCGAEVGFFSFFLLLYNLL